MFLEISDIDKREIIKGFSARFVHAKNFTIAYWDVVAGAELPEHSHHHEQTSQVLEGKFELSIAGKTKICEPGMIAVIPSHVIHKGKALTDCRILDIFSPVREDYQ